MFSRELVTLKAALYNRWYNHRKLNVPLRVVFYVNSIVWWQLLGKEAVDWQGRGFRELPSTQNHRFPSLQVVHGAGNGI